MYLLFLLGLCFILGMVGVAANPSPLYGAGALAISAVGGCGVLIGLGESFVGLVLLLIYLGGMLVVFAYSVALAAEPYPETWGGGMVLIYGVGYGLLVLFLAGWLVQLVIEGGEVGLFNLRGDSSGVVLLFSSGWCLLLLSGWGLLLALFVVLELVRGGSRGALRSP